MSNIIKIITALSVVFTFAGCRGTAPIKNVSNHMLPESARSMTNKQIGDKIKGVVSKREFYCNQVSSNQLVCSKNSRGHEAKLAIDYSQSDFSIRHVSTSNMKEGEGRVHPKYNQWVVNLERDIVKAFSESK